MSKAAKPSVPRRSAAMLAGLSARLVCAAAWGLFTLIAVNVMAGIHLAETALGRQAGGGFSSTFMFVWAVCSLLLSGLAAGALTWTHIALRRMEPVPAARS